MIAIALLLGVLCQPSETLWSEANQAYQEGQYDEALNKYEALAERGIENGKLHFNLGNAYFKKKQLGKAILHYHKAHRYMPGDADLKNNLAIADSQRLDPAIEEEGDALAKSLDLWLLRLPYRVIFFASLVFLVLAGFAAVALIIGRGGARWLGYVLVIGGVCGVLLAGVALVQYRHLQRSDQAIVVARVVDVRSGPTQSEPVNFTIHEGQRCSILEERPGWYRIRLANGFHGWVPRVAAETI